MRTLRPRLVGSWVTLFLSKFKINKRGCWIWTGNRTSRGYGLAGNKWCGCYAATGEVRSHRVSHVLFKGPIPDGKQVLHNCDTPRCINPKHIYAGTVKQNIGDREKRGRTVRHAAHESSNVKLTWNKVRKIRRLYATGKYSWADLGAQFHTDASNIGHIVLNRTWILRSTTFKPPRP